MIPTGWYSLSLAIGITLGAILAFTGKDRSLRWPAGAMILSLIAARAATGLPEAALGVLLVATPLCAFFAAGPLISPPLGVGWAEWDDMPRSRVSAVIAILYVPRLLCYAANAFSLLDRAMMWEFSNLFVIFQIAALFGGTWAGGHVVKDWITSGVFRKRHAVASGAHTSEPSR